MPTKVEPGNYSAVDFAKCVVLQSNDQKPVEYVVDREAAKMSGLIKDMLEDQEGDDQQTVIPIPNVNGRTLNYVLEYCEYHWNNRADPIDKPLRGKIEEVLCAWDKQFLLTDLIKGGDEKQHELLIDVIMAANFLNIKDLLDLTCASVASMIKGKTPEQIRALFNIENDFTPEEEEKIREENRSQVVWKDPVDPYAVSSSDDDGEKKKKKQEEAKKKKKKKTRPVATTTGRTAGNPPKLKADALETEKEIELGMATGMEGDLAIIKVNSHLEHTRKNVLYSKKDEVIQSMITLKKFVKLPDAPLARYLDLGEQEFQVIPQPPDPSKVFYVARPSASASASDTDVLALSPVTVTYHAHPCLQTAADNLDLTEIETRMRRKQLNLNFALRGVSLTLSEEKKFRENCKGYFGELTRNKFIQAWEAVKGDQPPPEGLVTSMFGTGTGFVLSVDDVVARLSGATLEEADAKALKVRENKEDAEQDLVEEVEGTERVFDDDIEDKPELDPDQSVMDKETKEWDNKKAKDDVGEGGVDGEGEEEEEAKKSHLQELAAGDIELPEPLEDEEDEDEDLTKKLPPPEPAAPNTTTTKNLRKRTASQAEGSKPAKPAAKKAGGKAAKKPKINPLHASIDEQLAKFLTSTPKPLSVLKKEVIFNLPQYAELKQEAFQKQAAGKIANKDQHVRTGITPWGALIVERINKAGGTVDPKGNAFLSK